MQSASGSESDQGAGPAASPERVRGWNFQTAADDWRVLGTSGVGAWFATSSHRQGAALAQRIAERVAAERPRDHLPPRIDLRADGVAVWISHDRGLSTLDLSFAQDVSAAARELSAVGDPSVLQDLDWGIETLDKPILLPYWQRLLGYEETADDDLLDPWRRDPRVWFYQAAPRPLRNRIHFDVVLPRRVADERATTAGALDGHGTATDVGGHHLLLADLQGNEVDLVPGDALDDPAASDWQEIFSAMTFYPTSGLAQSAALAAEVAGVADDVGLPLLIDLRPDGVVISTGKDRWEDRRFAKTARGVQAAARGLGLRADPSRLRFFQVCIDAVDVSAVRAFWCAALGYLPDQRESVTDIYDPRRLNHPIVFQRMDASDTARRQQRNRIHLDLYVPDDQVQARIQAALSAGGRLTGLGPGTIADPEGNEVDIGTAMAMPPEPATDPQG